MVAGARLAEWVSRLVQIPSVSPAHAGPRAGITGEARMAEQVATWFAEFGGEVRREEVLLGRSNVYGLWRGRSDRWLAVDVHMDTVSVEQMTGDPFDGRIEDGRVYGRGAVDTKATLGVVLGLLEAAHRQGRDIEDNLLIAATVDEEDGALGAPALARWIRDEGLSVVEMTVAEPTECQPIVAHKGVLRMDFVVEGESAHSSQPHFGKNAITGAARLALALDEENRRLQTGASLSAVGPGVLTVTVIHGGRGNNVVPDACVLHVDRRLAPGEEPEEVAARLAALADAECPLRVVSKVCKQIRPFHQPAGGDWLRRMAEWCGAEPTTAPYCTNAWAYPGTVQECVVIGPGSIAQALGVDEWVEIAELEKLAGIYARWWGLKC